MHNDVFGEFDTRRLISHSSAEVLKACTYKQDFVTITTRLEANYGPCNFHKWDVET